MRERKTWEDCVAFHGHICPGLAIGYKASLYTMELLELNYSEDEELVCITENDACCVDGIQVMLGCSVGKGNLLFHIRGKWAFSFYHRTNQKSVRLILKCAPGEYEGDNMFQYYRTSSPGELFEVKEPSIVLPERARSFASYHCDRCGEAAGANWIRLCGDG